MYIRLLCRRYLFTRYIALVCIVSVTLGVATMIVVNSVMEGFSHEMQSRLNGMLGDLVIRTRTIDGIADPLAHMEKIRRVAGADVVGMSPTVPHARAGLHHRRRAVDHAAGDPGGHRRGNLRLGQQVRPVPAAPTEP